MPEALSLDLVAPEQLQIHFTQSLVAEDGSKLANNTELEVPIPRQYTLEFYNEMKVFEDNVGKPVLYFTMV